MMDFSVGLSSSTFALVVIETPYSDCTVITGRSQQVRIHRMPTDTVYCCRMPGKLCEEFSCASVPDIYLNRIFFKTLFDEKHLLNLFLYIMPVNESEAKNEKKKL